MVKQKKKHERCVTRRYVPATHDEVMIEGGAEGKGASQQSSRSSGLATWKVPCFVPESPVGVGFPLCRHRGCGGKRPERNLVRIGRGAAPARRVGPRIQKKDFLGALRTSHSLSLSPYLGRAPHVVTAAARIRHADIFGCTNAPCKGAEDTA